MTNTTKTETVEVTYYEPTYGMLTFKTTDLARDLEWLDAGGYTYRTRKIGQPAR